MAAESEHPFGMNRLALITLAAATLLASGCESVPRVLRSRLEQSPKASRAFPDMARDEVFYACQGALRRIEFRLARTDQSRGIVVGNSRVHSGGSFRDSWQYEMNLWVAADESGTTTVGALLVEVLESPASGNSRKAIKEHGLYESFFTALNAELADPGGRR